MHEGPQPVFPAQTAISAGQGGEPMNDVEARTHIVGAEVVDLVFPDRQLGILSAAEVQQVLSQDGSNYHYGFVRNPDGTQVFCRELHTNSYGSEPIPGTDVTAAYHIRTRAVNKEGERARTQDDVCACEIDLSRFDAVSGSSAHLVFYPRKKSDFRMVHEFAEELLAEGKSADEAWSQLLLYMREEGMRPSGVVHTQAGCREKLAQLAALLRKLCFWKIHPSDAETQVQPDREYNKFKVVGLMSGPADFVFAANESGTASHHLMYPEEFGDFSSPDRQDAVVRYLRDRIAADEIIFLMVHKNSPGFVMAMLQLADTLSARLENGSERVMLLEMPVTNATPGMPRELERHPLIARWRGNPGNSRRFVSFFEAKTSLDLSGGRFRPEPGKGNRAA